MTGNMSGVVLDEILVFSDHHAHPFTYGAKEVEWGGTLMNSRLVDSCRVLQQMNTYAFKNKIKTIVFCGDLFHTREAVPTDAYNATFEMLYSLLAGRTSFLIPGNHDYHDRAGLVHSLDTLKYWRNNGSLKVAKVVDWRTTDKCFVHTGSRGDDYMLCFVPYTEDRSLAINTIKAHADVPFAGPKLLVAHLGMQGATVGSDYVLVNPGDVAVDDIQYDKFAGCLFGHYHQHQKLFPNGWYVGATHHHTWGDVNTKRGFLHVRVYIDHIDFDFIESESSRFLAVTEAELDTVKINEDDFVKIVTDKKLSLEQANKVRAKAKSQVCEVVYVPPEIKMKEISLDEQQLSPTAMVETWVRANEDWVKEHLPNVEQSDLVNYGRTLLAKAQEQQ